VPVAMRNSSKFALLLHTSTRFMHSWTQSKPTICASPPSLFPRKGLIFTAIIQTADCRIQTQTDVRTNVCIRCVTAVLLQSSTRTLLLCYSTHSLLPQSQVYDAGAPKGTPRRRKMRHGNPRGTKKEVRGKNMMFMSKML